MLKLKLKQINARKIATLGVIVFLLLLSVAFFYPLISTGKRRINPERVKDLAPLAELSVRSINVSSKLAYDSIWSDVNDNEILDIGATAESALKSLEEVEEVVKATVGGSLRERLLNATYSYENVSSASINSSKTALLLDEARPGVMLALDLLLKGNVTGALGVWSGVESQVIGARLLVGNSIKRLIEIDQSSLFSEAHELAVNESLSRLEELENELDQIISLFLLVKEKPEEVEKILKTALSLESGEQIDVNLSEFLENEGIQAVIQASQNLNPSNAGRFAYQIGRFKSLMQLPCTCQQLQQGGLPGSGAGREERPDD